MNSFKELSRQIFDDDLLETAYPKLVEQLIEAAVKATREHCWSCEFKEYSWADEIKCPADIARRAKLILRSSDKKFSPARTIDQ